MVYILTNFDTTLDQDLYRIQLCRELNFSPYPMIYDKEHCKPIYKKLQRWCSNFIFWSVPTFEDYLGKDTASPTGQIVANGELYPGEFDNPLAAEGSDKE